MRLLTELGPRLGFAVTIIPEVKLGERDVLFIDEIHRLSRAVEEILYPAMEDYQLDIMIGEGPAARSIKLDLPPFTLVGATTRAGMLTNPLRDRFGIVARLEFYNAQELQSIVSRSATLLNAPIDPEGALEIARRARGTPRTCSTACRRCTIASPGWPARSCTIRSWPPRSCATATTSTRPCCDRRSPPRRRAASWPSPTAPGDRACPGARRRGCS